MQNDVVKTFIEVQLLLLSAYFISTNAKCYRSSFLSPLMRDDWYLGEIMGFYNTRHYSESIVIIAGSSSLWNKVYYDAVSLCCVCIDHASITVYNDAMCALVTSCFWYNLAKIS